MQRPIAEESSQPVADLREFSSRFGHYIPRIAEAAVEVRARQPLRNGDAKYDVFVTLAPADNNGSVLSAEQWREVERIVFDLVRSVDLKLSDGRSVVIAMPATDADGARVAVARLRERLHEALRQSEETASIDNAIALTAYTPSALPKPDGNHSTGGRSTERVYDIDSRTTSVLRDRNRDSILLRALDALCAGVGIFLTVPLFVIIGVSIKLTSPGPVLFRQRRVGRKGEMFTMLKFRTMHTGAPDDAHRTYMEQYVSGAELQVNVDAKDPPLYKLSNDKRIFRVGAFLRKWSLDELPQLLNVLTGDMSLVGPRPSVDYELAHYKPWHRERLDVKPGLTGPWQVYGRGRMTFDEMVRLDIRYVREHTLVHYLKFLLLTGPAVLNRTGAQ